MKTNHPAATRSADTIASITQRVVDVVGAADTAVMLGVNVSTIYRWRAGVKSPAQGRRETALRTAHAACAILSGLPDEQIRSWFLTPHRDLAFRTPQALVVSDGAAVLRAADFTARDGEGSSESGRP